jgi:hypothetical protein
MELQYSKGHDRREEEKDGEQIPREGVPAVNHQELDWPSKERPKL